MSAQLGAKSRITHSGAFAEEAVQAYVSAPHKGSNVSIRLILQRN